MALLCVLGFSSYAIIIRRNSKSEMLPTLILSNLIIMIIVLIYTSDDLLIFMNDAIRCFLIGGVLQATANILLIIASKHVLAAELTLFMLLEFTFAPIWVWLFIHEVPSSWTLVGGGVVTLAVLTKTLLELRKVSI